MSDWYGMAMVGTVVLCGATAYFDARSHGSVQLLHWTLLTGGLLGISYLSAGTSDQLDAESGSVDTQLGGPADALLLIIGVIFAAYSVTGAATSMWWGPLSLLVMLTLYALSTDRRKFSGGQSVAFALIFPVSLSYVVCVSLGAAVLGRESPPLSTAIQIFRFLIAVTYILSAFAFCRYETLRKRWSKLSD